MFAKFCKEMGAEHFFTVLQRSRWLYHKKFCCASLNSEMIVNSINDERHRNAHMFLNCDFHTPLAFLGDVSDKMNIL